MLSLLLKSPPPAPLPIRASSLAISGFVISICACVVAVAGLILGIISLVKLYNIQKVDVKREEKEPEIYQCGDKRYQLLASVWDHETGDFKILYKCLYEVQAKVGSYEKHEYAVSHYSRFRSKFTRVAAREGEGEKGWKGDTTVECKGVGAKVVKGKEGSENEARVGTRKWLR